VHTKEGSPSAPASGASSPPPRIYITMDTRNRPRHLQHGSAPAHTEWTYEHIIDASSRPFACRACFFSMSDMSYTPNLVMLASDPETLRLSLDCRSTYNAVTCASILEAVVASTPGLMPLLYWAYGEASRIQLFLHWAYVRASRIFVQGAVENADSVSSTLSTNSVPCVRAIPFHPPGQTPVLTRSLQLKLQDLTWTVPSQLSAPLLQQHTTEL
jgi:hypothetical protein